MYSALSGAEQGIRVLEGLLERRSDLAPEKEVLWFIHACVLKAETEYEKSTGIHPSTGGESYCLNGMETVKLDS